MVLVVVPKLDQGCGLVELHFRCTRADLAILFQLYTLVTYQPVKSFKGLENTTVDETAEAEA